MTEVVRWRGTDQRGEFRGGRSLMTPAEVADLVERRFHQGWRELRVYRGDGPVPPAELTAECRVAAIEKHPETGHRTWWAENGADR